MGLRMRMVAQVMQVWKPVGLVLAAVEREEPALMATG
jgi:hypothetical protein